jgi:hypothetical protein
MGVKQVAISHQINAVELTDVWRASGGRSPDSSMA